MTEDEVHKQARKRVEARIGFYVHLAIYVCVNALLVGVNLAASPDALWFVWPMLGWGIGLMFHGLAVFLFSSGRKVKEKMIEREIARQEAAIQGGSVASQKDKSA